MTVVFVKSSVEYLCKWSEVHSQKRQDKYETNKKIKRKQKEQRLEINELFYKTEVWSGAYEG